LFEAARLFKVCRRRLFRSLGVRLIKSGAVNETGDRTQRGSTPRLELLSFPTPTLTFIALGPIDILGTGRVGMAVAAIFFLIDKILFLSRCLTKRPFSKMAGVLGGNISIEQGEDGTYGDK
jgi:hypothetical protein